MSLKGKLQCIGLTDTGRVREHNEDTIACGGRTSACWCWPTAWAATTPGEVASGIAVKTIVNLVREAIEHEDLIGAGPGLRHVARVDHPARCHSRAPTRSSTRPPAPSPTARAWAPRWSGALFHDNRVTIAHVGDSRMYRLRDSGFEQMTLDHSLAAGAGRPGLLFASKRRSAPPTRITLHGRSVSKQRSKWRSRNSRPRVVTYT